MKVGNVAVIGVGYWGPNIVRNLLRISSIKNVYVFDIRKENLDKIKKDFPNILTTKSYNEILGNKDISAIIISTPLETHYELAVKALKSGKHILLEKPVTSTSIQAKKLIKLAKKNKLIFMAGHTFVYSNAVSKIKENIVKNELGKIYYYDSIRINLGIIRSDSNVIWDLAPHDFSILNYLINEKPKSVFAFGNSYISNSQVEVAHILLRYENKITAHINVSWLSPVKIRSIIIGGSKKMILYNDIEVTEKIRIYNKGVTAPISEITPFSPAYRSGDIIIPKLFQNEALFSELSHFLDCIEKNKRPITDGESGLEIVKLLEATNRSLRTKKIVET